MEKVVAFHPGKYYLIQHIDHENLFWNGVDGWSDRKRADFFFEFERMLNPQLPKKGCWLVTNPFKRSN